ncbi:acyloxyacyl hydrolase-like [Dendronephthya gigantea]|uniref:acyloxyacyl hydrolase-like n=1 Tax=Dendronephthya gigantea TaxID=151771 RepID=UPI00106D1C69|nr:acyloxyacyl hydrolase-like [Dendronephthya gigantea]
MTVIFQQRFLFYIIGASFMISRSEAVEKGANGGVYCLGCTAIVSLTQQLSEYHNVSFSKSFRQLCSYFPPPLSYGCSILGEVFMHKIKPYQFSSPDVICHKINICYNEKGQPECKLYPDTTTKDQFTKTNKNVEGLANGKLSNHIKEERIAQDVQLGFDICTLPVIDWICGLVKQVFRQGKPIFDLDGDRFSAYLKLRGSAWRGKDCNDFFSSHYPGRKPFNGDMFFDSNCNGIYGYNLQQSRTWEDILCAESSPQGTIALGDSMTAHFHIPPEWLTATEITKDIFKDLWLVLTNEFDWPMMSAFTGYYNQSDWPHIISGPIDSVYKHIVKRNLCNHRDYQNIGKNGADSFTMNDELVGAMARDQKADRPALVFYSLVGNDVCNSDPTGGGMTTVEQMRANALKTMSSFDKILPNGSHVAMIGLADGRVLFDAMHNRTHPIGKLRNDVTYARLYDFLNCLQISPCAGWLNSNETIRNATSKRARELSAVLKNIAETQKYQNFDLVFFPNVFEEVINIWNSMGAGHETWQLIEPVDGFHPNQNAMALVAKVLVKVMETKTPHFLGDVNPHNEMIKKLFGDQGGYK